MAHTSADAGVSKCAKGLGLLAVLGLTVGSSRKKIAKQDHVYMKDASHTLKLITTGDGAERQCLSHQQCRWYPGSASPPSRYLGVGPRPGRSVSRRLYVHL
jgi:hypothetical protein